MLTVIGHPRSRAMRVMWMLEELGLDYDIVPAPPRSEEAIRHNPAGKIPSLIVDGETLFDSVAIIQFLADRAGKLTHPCGTVARARQDGFTHFAVDEVYGALWIAAKHDFVLPEELRIPGVDAAARHEFDRAMKTLEERLGDNAYVMGDEITVPDLILGHCAGWAEKGVSWDLPGGAVGDYFARVRARPALARAMARGAAALAG